MTNPTLRIYRGIPGSGKTTDALQWINTPSDVGAPKKIRVSRDDLRKATYGVYWGEQIDENLITKLEHSAIDIGLKAGADVAVDATNLRASNVKKLITLARKHNATVEFMDFEVSLATALERDAAREKPVGERVVRSFYDRYTRKGKLVAPPEVEAGPLFKPAAEWDLMLPDAIIVDIDGTLAHIPEGGRSPYDGSRVHEDLVDEAIREIVTIIDTYGWNILITSGRDAKYRRVTADWLEDKGIWYDRIFMRPEGDQRNDAIVKDELYEQNIRGKYNVRFVLDDRNRVVDMWRAKGLKTLQVAPGDF